MSNGDLKTLLDDVPDTLEIVLRGEPDHQPARKAWRNAREDAAWALRVWRTAPGNRAAYTVYRAAQDREDAAQDTLAHTQTFLSSVS